MGTQIPLEVVRVFWDWIEAVVAQYCDYNRGPSSVPFKMVDLMLGECHLRKQTHKKSCKLGWSCACLSKKNLREEGNAASIMKSNPNFQRF